VAVHSFLFVIGGRSVNIFLGSDISETVHCTFVKSLQDGYVTVAVWLSGNTLASINVVALRQTRLVLGWVTVCGRVNYIGM